MTAKMLTTQIYFVTLVTISAESVSFQGENVKRRGVWVDDENVGYQEIRVLVVDDEESMRATLATYISRLGVRVRVAADVSEARRALQSELPPFDVVLTDLKLPDGSGFDVVKDAHARSSAALVTIITGFASLETAIEAIRLGAHDYVTKPFSLDQIGITVRNMIDRVMLARENARLSLRLQELLSEVERLRSEKIDLGRVLEEIQGGLADNGRKLDYLLEQRASLPRRNRPAEESLEQISPNASFYVPGEGIANRPARAYSSSAVPSSNRRGSA
jgi:ActR/RegA family two-component response regulator